MEQNIDLRVLYKALRNIERNMVTKHELFETLETVAVLSNDKTMRQISASEADVRAGRVRKVQSVRDL